MAKRLEEHDGIPAIRRVRAAGPGAELRHRPPSAAVGDFFKHGAPRRPPERSGWSISVSTRACTASTTANVYSARQGRRGPRGGDRRPPRPGPRLDQGHVPHGAGAQRLRLLPPGAHRAPWRRACGASAPTTSTSTTCMASMPRRRWMRRSARWTTSCTQRQDSLHRLLQLLRLAPDEVAVGVRALRLGALCRASGLLFARRRANSNGS